MSDTARDSLFQILTEEGLLSEEHIRMIKSKETLLRSKILKSKTPGLRPNIVDQSLVSLIDIIESLRLSTPKTHGKIITADMIMTAVARHLQMPFIKIDPLKLNYDLVTQIISRPYAIRHQIVPIALSDNTLTVATADPFDTEAIDWIQRVTGYRVERVVTTKADILKIITEFYGFKSAITSAHKEIDTKTDLSDLEQYVRLKSITELEATDQHIVNALEYLLHYAYSSRASDIHIEPKREFSLIRFRIDGILHNIHKIPKAVHPPIVSRIKTLARMDISEKRRPQDGRIKTAYEGKEIELRISSIPVTFGEKIVVRIFDPIILMQDIGELGFFPKELQMVKSFIANTHGIILVTGPTGSGKTTTLYSLLRILSTSEVNVCTIEDPIEMVYEGFNQTAVHPHIDLTFANCLRHLLRQDPDIIMVGEIRDLETAENAIQAALTGHLVFSTLHTNDAPSSITRLIDLGVPPFLLNATVLGVMAQRLVRKVCIHCREEYALSRDECIILKIDYEKAKNYKVAIGRGCEECRGTGYLGRTGIFEMMQMTEKVREHVHENTSPQLIKKIALGQGMNSLRENAIRKLLQGTTTVDEVIRVTGIM
ncbi:MAG: ATPase, T2SS/T4P/T4SS family [Nitrospirota bacterium]